MKARAFQVLILGLIAASLVLLYAATPPQQRSISLAPTNPLLVAPDPFANTANSADGLKPGRPFYYVVDNAGLTIMRLTDNSVLYRIPWPQTVIEWVVMPDGEFVSLPVPPLGWEPVGMTVSYPTEEALASNSETPSTYVYVVMKHSGVQWASNPNPPDLRDPGVRDELVTATSEATEASMLLQVDVTDPSFLAAPPVVAAAILGHGAGQPAIDPSTGNVYVGNMPSRSLPTNLQAFVSVIAPLAPPVPEAVIPGVPTAPEAPLVNVCGPEHPDEGLLIGEPYVWACGESGDGPAVWEFQNLPPWLSAHVDKNVPILDGRQNLDGLLYGVPPVNGTWTFQARVIDYGDTENGPQTSEWTTWTVNVMPTGVAAEAEAGFEAGIPGGMGVPGTGTCEPAPTATPGSIVPRWIDVQPAYIGNSLKGCFVMGTAPISGEYYEFILPNFHFLYPFDREAVIFSGNAVGAYGFDPLPLNVSLSGLAWHQIEKLHDPSTEADIVNAEFIGVEPFTGQLYRILLPQGSIEVGTVVAPPETSVELDEITPEGQPLVGFLRTDLGGLLSGNRTVAFGDLAVEADRDIFVNVPWILDPDNSTVIPIGGPTGSQIENGALIKVSNGTGSTIDLPGVQANSLALNSDLRPAIPGVEPGQTDNGILWVTGTTTGNVAMVDIVGGQNQVLAVDAATSLGGVSVDTGGGVAYVAGSTLQSVILFGSSVVPPRAPVIWGISPNVGIELAFDLGVNGSFKIVTTGSPTPALFCGMPVETCGGTLPAGLTFTENGDGTATIAGTPQGTIGGDYTSNLEARNGVSPDASTPMLITVNSPPIITSPNTATFEVGVSGSFTVTTAGPGPSFTCPIPVGGAEGGNPPAGTCVDPPTWLAFTDNGDGTGTLAGIPPEGSQGSFVFNILVTNDIPPDASQDFTLVVVTPGAHYAPQVTTQPLSQSVTEGEMAAFSAAASGYPVPSVQWQVSTDGVAWSDIAGATTTGHSISAATIAMSGSRFRAVFTNDTGTAISNGAILTVRSLSAPAITMQPYNQTVTAGQAANFTSAASGAPTPTVQWQLSTDLGMSWSDIAGATNASYTTPSTTSAMNDYQYRAVFTNGSGTARSNGAILTVVPAQTSPAVTTHPFSQTVTEGQVANFAATASGNPYPTVQWQLSVNSGSTWANITGATSPNYTTPATTVAMNGYQYRAVFTNSLGTTNSNVAFLTVNARPVVTTQPSNQTILVGQTASFTATASGNPRPSVQWQLSTNSGLNWSNISGATSTTYNTSATAAMNGYQYRAVFTNAFGTANSNVAVLTVNEAPAIVSGNAATFTVGTAGSFMVTATGLPMPSLSYWGMLPGGVTFTNQGNGTAILAGTPSGGGTFQITITAANGVTPNATQFFTLTVNAPQGIAPAFTSANSTIFTAGTPGSFTVRTTGTPTPTLSAWGVPAGLNFTNNGNGTGTLAGTVAAGSYQFVIIATNGVSPDAIQYFTLTVNSGTPQPLAVTTTTLSSGRTNRSYSAQLQATGGTTPYSWGLASGSLPRGLTLYQNGVISGTPTRTGNSTFTVRVTDSANRTATRSLTLRITN